MTNDKTNNENSRRIHEPDEPCPFRADSFLLGGSGNCCSLRGKNAARELEAMGDVHLCERMYYDMTAAEAITFATELRETADDLEEEHRGADPLPRGAGRMRGWKESTLAHEWQSYSTFAESLASIRHAADWYEKVGRLGFGVRASY